MNQEKIGRFIAELRKEKNMTQKDLANKLGITDRAISKWENGRGMPDLSLLTSLCEVLEIKVNELLSGEKLDNKNYQEELEKNIINTIDYTNKKLNNIKKIFLGILSVILLFIILFFTLFNIDINRMKNNKSVLFSTWGYDYVTPIDIREDKIEMAIINYLIDKGDGEYKHYENEKMFASIKIYLLEENNNYYNVYAWGLGKKYYLENGEIVENSSLSIPFKFVVEKKDDDFVVKDSRIPRNGSYYYEDMKNIFPKSVRNDISNVYKDGTIERLELDIKQQVKLYFHL